MTIDLLARTIIPSTLGKLIFLEAATFSGSLRVVSFVRFIHEKSSPDVRVLRPMRSQFNLFLFCVLMNKFYLRTKLLVMLGWLESMVQKLFKCLAGEALADLKLISEMVSCLPLIHPIYTLSLPCSGLINLITSKLQFPAVIFFQFKQA